jgi:hypothetical protein
MANLVYGRSGLQSNFLLLMVRFSCFEARALSCWVLGPVDGTLWCFLTCVGFVVFVALKHVHRHLCGLISLNIILWRNPGCPYCNWSGHVFFMMVAAGRNVFYAICGLSL